MHPALENASFHFQPSNRGRGAGFNYAYVGRNGAFQLNDANGAAMYFWQGQYNNSPNLVYYNSGSLIYTPISAGDPPAGTYAGQVYQRNGDDFFVFLGTDVIAASDWAYGMWICPTTITTQGGFWFYQYARRAAL
jgi:hypothetical protein